MNTIPGSAELNPWAVAPVPAPSTPAAKSADMLAMYGYGGYVISEDDAWRQPVHASFYGTGTTTSLEAIAKEDEDEYGDDANGVDDTNRLVPAECELTDVALMHVSPSSMLTVPPPGVLGAAEMADVNNPYVVDMLAPSPTHTPGPTQYNAQSAVAPELNLRATSPLTFSVGRMYGNVPQALPLLEQQTVSMKLAEHTQHFRGGNALIVLKAIEARTMDVNLANEAGETALHKAATAGDETSVDFLLKNGANPDAQNHSGYTPLMFACIYGHRVVVQMILDAGANVHLQRHIGGGALELASHPVCGYPMIVRILEEYIDMHKRLV